MEQADNQTGHYRILGMMHTMSILLLFVHFYFYCYDAFRRWGFTHPISDRILASIYRTGIFSHFQTAKLAALGLLALSTLGRAGKKSTRIGYRQPICFLAAGMALYFTSFLVFNTGLPPGPTAFAYILITMLGYLLTLHGLGLASRILHHTTDKDIFNELNESFPQEERLLANEDTLNFRTRYHFRKRTLKGWINIDPFRGLLVMGSPGSGKSWYIIRSIIRQHLAKGFTMVVYDFKYNDLTLLAYNCWLRHPKAWPVRPRFYNINFEDLSRSHRCNPLDPSLMTDLADAADSAITFLLGLNKDWVERQGDFWVESSISFMTALIWYLKLYKGGIYCTLPHVIELLQVEYNDLFSISASSSRKLPGIPRPSTCDFNPRKGYCWKRSNKCFLVRGRRFPNFAVSDNFNL